MNSEDSQTTGNSGAENSGAENSVRSYLLWLDDPSKLRDQSAIESTRAAIERETDPIQRLKAISRLEALEAVDGEVYRLAFVQHAKTWASANGVSADAFSQLGVGAKELRAAGLAGRGANGKTSRRTRVSPETVRNSLPEGPFRIADIESRSGASTATVRKVVLALVAEGKVVDLGPDQSHTGRGRAPLKYRKDLNRQ